jgi:glutamyl-tRNA reductase
MKLLVTGVNHRTAPVSVREKLAFPQPELPGALEVLLKSAGITEGLILSTCNRVEIAVTAREPADLRASVEEFLSGSQGVSSEWLRPFIYEFEGRDAIRHIFRVAASLDSMVIGEPQILGQLKSAYAVAKNSGALNGFLETVMTRAFGVAKRVRTETEIGTNAVSISYAAVELAREIFGSLAQQRVMLIGAGKMSELAARHLRKSGVQQILVANRTYGRAEQLASAVNGTVVSYSEYRLRLKDADIVITSSGASGYLLGKEDMRRIIEARRNRPMFLIDIAVPRNIDPEVNELDNVFLYDIDDLQRVVDENLQSRLDQAKEADRIIDEEVERLENWLRTRQVGPLIASLQDQLEQIRAGELERVRGRLGSLTPQQEQAVEALTRGIVNKIAHGPISELRRNAGTADNNTVLEAIRKAFRLGGN